MQRRDEFLAKALSVHGDYEKATAVIRGLRVRDVIDGPEWDSAVASQKAALDAWLALLDDYPELQPGHEKYPG
ncbi:hypothetical protein [Pseudomonas sp. KK4]|uniref:hypothetical protein n=1 Tax=Pseudomonas sp. KK4 TaxID=1855729 RepID=UPI00097BA90A|nr:hypothetical protein [Pseudomonas sp. KK4]